MKLAGLQDYSLSLSGRGVQYGTEDEVFNFELDTMYLITEMILLFHMNY